MEGGHKQHSVSLVNIADPPARMSPNRRVFVGQRIRNLRCQGNSHFIVLPATATALPSSAATGVATDEDDDVGDVGIGFEISSLPVSPAPVIVTGNTNMFSSLHPSSDQ